VAKASQPKQINAEPNSDTKRRSPRVVSKRSTHVLGAPPGEMNSQRVISVSRLATVRKNTAVGSVQAIQDKSNGTSILLVLRVYVRLLRILGALRLRVSFCA
jgi:hypothetical protein